MGAEAKTRNRLTGWIDGRTLALGTLMVALAAVAQTGFGSLRTEMIRSRAEVQAGIRELRAELRADLRGLDERLRNVEVGLRSLDLRLENVEARLDSVEARLENVEARLERMEVRLDGVEGRLVRVEAALPDPGRDAVALVPPPADGDAAGRRGANGGGASIDALPRGAP